MARLFFLQMAMMLVLLVPDAYGRNSDDRIGVLQRPAAVFWPRATTSVHAVIVFTRFRDEEPSYTEAPSWAQYLFAYSASTVKDYFDKVSFGRIDVNGSYLPHVYELPQSASYYVGNLNQYSLDVLALLRADPEINFANFDNDGPDNIPGSSDDNGFVDFMIFMPRTRPEGFIQNLATGVYSLGLKNVYFTGDKKADGEYIKVDAFSGCIATAKNYAEALGTIVSEVSHTYGAVDLMDKRWDSHADDSAGVGNWDPLGRGALGWDGDNVVVGPNAYNRWIMGCVGINNDRIVDLYGLHQNVRVPPVGTREGIVYRIWIGEKEYFLIENRQPESLYYDRSIPAGGLMIWHVYTKSTNDRELLKECDLECADGRYLDKGYPLGAMPDPLKGGDNLDFWAHDQAYRLTYGGNTGDASDVFDGEVYTEFGTDTNPSSHSKETLEPTGVEIFNIRRDGEDMLFDCILPFLSPWFENRFPLVGGAVQRFSAPDMRNNSSAKTAYAVHTGFDPIADVLVTIDGSDMSVEHLNGMDSHQVERMTATRLVGADDVDDSNLVVRQTVPIEELASILSEFGISAGDVTGERNPVSVVRITLKSAEPELPVTIRLRQNFPNPFNAVTTVPYALNQSGQVTLQVYNVLGQRVMSLDQGWREPGTHSVLINANGLASGMYLYRISGTASRSPMKRFILVK